MSGAGKPLGDLMYVWSEKFFTNKSLDLEEIKRWAISITGSRILVLTREQEIIDAKFATGFERVRVRGQVFCRDRIRLDSKSWKAHKLTNELISAFGTSQSLEIELNF